jgi:hypothetical protein
VRTYDDRVTSGSSGSLWRRFEHDPRDPAYSGLRASDRDRAVVQDVLAEAYAEGRLDRDELDERTSIVDAAKTYADLVPPLRDLTIDAAASAITQAPRADLERKAHAHYREELGEAFMGLLVPNLICWAIWFFAGTDFPWPIFVLIPTLGNFVRVVASKQSIIDGRIDKLERKQAKALEPPKPKAPKKADGPAGEAILSEQEKPEQA